MCLYFTFRQMKKKTQISGNERKFKKQLLNKTRLLSNLLYKQKKLYFTTTLQKEITRTHKPQKLDCSLTAKQTFWNETTTHARESDSTSRPTCARKFDFFSSHCSIPFPNKQQHHQRERERETCFCPGNENNYAVTYFEVVRVSSSSAFPDCSPTPCKFCWFSLRINQKLGYFHTCQTCLDWWRWADLAHAYGCGCGRVESKQWMEVSFYSWVCVSVGRVNLFV